MVTDDTSRYDDPTIAVVSLSTVTLLAGVSGMVVSILYLASQSHLDVIAGGVGFIASAILVASGLISLSVQSRSSITSKAATQVACCLVGLLPPVVAALSWPTLYFGAFPAVNLMPIVLIVCIGWAWVQSRRVAKHLAELAGWRQTWFIQAAVFGGQSVTIIATWPLFGYFLDQLSSMGYKVGWS